MVNIVVAFSRPEDGRNIKNILTKNGLPVAASCTSGAQVLAHADDLRSGIVVSGFRYGDMNCRQLRRALTPEFDIIVIASP
ncbi:MAG: antitermination regulator, partial [Clostridium sp.]|nr:antitermination regulator [Clostridium sp.]